MNGAVLVVFTLKTIGFVGAARSVPLQSATWADTKATKVLPTTIGATGCILSLALVSLKATAISTELGLIPIFA